MRQISNSDEDNSYCQLAYRIMIRRVDRADKMRKTAIKKDTAEEKRVRDFAAAVSLVGILIRDG